MGIFVDFMVDLRPGVELLLGSQSCGHCYWLWRRCLQCYSASCWSSARRALDTCWSLWTRRRRHAKVSLLWLLKNKNSLPSHPRSGRNRTAWATTFTFMNLADALSKATYSAFRLYIFFFLSVCVFPGNWTHNLFVLQMQCSTTEPQELQLRCIYSSVLTMHVFSLSFALSADTSSWAFRCGRWHPWDEGRGHEDVHGEESFYSRAVP